MFMCIFIKYKIVRLYFSFTIFRSSKNYAGKNVDTKTVHSKMQSVSYKKEEPEPLVSLELLIL